MGNLSSRSVSSRAPDRGGAPSALWYRVVHGDRSAAARLISLIENEADGVEEELLALVPHTGKAHVVGITGSPGSGKSTLVGQMAKEYRSRGKSVGIIAVDPTSPFTGGAVLGDRVRMQGLATDRGVFIRSMASRGALGGLARATADAIKVLDALGCDVVLVETVGAGQDEVDIARTAHTTVVVQVPGMGDEVQAIKAGILEIGDVFAVNKADRVRADAAVSELRMMLEMNSRPAAWVPPIVKTIATRGTGVDELVTAIEQHMEQLCESGALRGRLAQTAERELVEAVSRQLMKELTDERGGAFQAAVKAMVERTVDARTAARKLVEDFRVNRGDGGG